VATIRSEITGTVWQIKVAVGDAVAEGDELIVLESMKMEIPVVAPAPGTVVAIHVTAEGHVHEGDPLADVDA
jgi:biotin carboxyl carrier protein